MNAASFRIEDVSLIPPHATGDFAFGKELQRSGWKDAFYPFVLIIICAVATLFAVNAHQSNSQKSFSLIDSFGANVMFLLM